MSDLVSILRSPSSVITPHTMCDSNLNLTDGVLSAKNDHLEALSFAVRLTLTPYCCVKPG
jgi:hypothetical protein